MYVIKRLKQYVNADTTGSTYNMNEAKIFKTYEQAMCWCRLYAEERVVKL